MSIFRPINLGCPSCGTAVEFQAVHSVNADRRPDLRLAILEETFQEQACPKCGKTFRLDPEFNLMDVQRGQWIAAAPLASLANWKAMEDRAKGLFDKAYGEDAAEVAQEIGQKLHPRVTFGWPALREKLIAHDNELDDVTLELVKLFVMRNSDSPVSADTELRLVDVTPDGLTLAWLLAAEGDQAPTMQIARTLYDQIAADEDGAWEDLREEISAGPFVDLNRMLIPEVAVAAPVEADDDEA